MAVLLHRSAGARGYCVGAGRWCTALTPCCAGECSFVTAGDRVCVPDDLAADKDGGGRRRRGGKSKDDDKDKKKRRRRRKDRRGNNN